MEEKQAAVSAANEKKGPFFAADIVESLAFFKLLRTAVLQNGAAESSSKDSTEGGGEDGFSILQKIGRGFGGVGV